MQIHDQRAQAARDTIESVRAIESQFGATREALEDDGAKILGEVRRHARTLGMTEVFKMYDASHARQSVEHVATLMDASATWSPHRLTALD